MKTQVIDNTSLHFEHVNWKNELLFWKDEIKTFQKRLEEVVVLWTNKDVLSKVDQFQNSLIIHNRKIVEMLEAIEAHEHNIAQHLKANEDALDINYINNHLKFREELDTERKLYNDLKKRFFLFVSKSL